MNISACLTTLRKVVVKTSGFTLLETSLALLIFTEANLYTHSSFDPKPQITFWADIFLKNEMWLFEAQEPSSL